MAEEPTLTDDIADRTGTQVGIIGNNIADTAGELGEMLKEGLLTKLEGSIASSFEPPPPPDVTMPEPPAQAHDILKQAAITTVIPSGETETTLHEQLELAKQQMAQLGK